MEDLVILWSGGADSTLLLDKALKKFNSFFKAYTVIEKKNKKILNKITNIDSITEEDTKDLQELPETPHLYVYSFDSKFFPGNDWQFMHRSRLKTIFRRRYPLAYKKAKWIEVKLPKEFFPLTSTRGGSCQMKIWLGNIISFIHRYNCPVQIGYCKGDDAIFHISGLQNLENWIKIYNEGSIPNFEFTFPLQWTTKSEIYKYLAENSLLEAVALNSGNSYGKDRKLKKKITKKNINYQIIDDNVTYNIIVSKGEDKDGI